MIKKLNEAKKNNKGFSLVELIIVIAIMVVLIAVLAPMFLKYVERSRQSTDISNAKAIISAVEVLAVDDSATNQPASGTVTIQTDADTDGSNDFLDEAIANANVESNRLKSDNWGDVILTFTIDDEGHVDVTVANDGETDFATESDLTVTP